MPKGKKITNSIKKLEEIVSWFEERSEIDVEEGLLKMRDGVALIKELKTKLVRAENEFEEIKKELSEEE